MAHLNGADRVFLVSFLGTIAVNAHQIVATDLICESLELVTTVGTEVQEVGLVVVTNLALLELREPRSRTVEGHDGCVATAFLNLAGRRFLGEHLAATRRTDARRVVVSGLRLV